MPPILSPCNAGASAVRAGQRPRAAHLCCSRSTCICQGGRWHAKPTRCVEELHVSFGYLGDKSSVCGFLARWALGTSMLAWLALRTYAFVSSMKYSLTEAAAPMIAGAVQDSAAAALDSAGGGFSYCNEAEARAAVAVLERLLAAGMAAENVGVISPYNGQVGGEGGGMFRVHPSTEPCMAHQERGGVCDGSVAGAIALFGVKGAGLGLDSGGRVRGCVRGQVDLSH